MGCRVVTRPNGRDAVELFARESFDLVLMDCEMPVMDGFEAARRIRELERLLHTANNGAASPPRTAIVAVTAHALTTVHEKCLQAGMDDFLVKPFDELRLGEALRRWLPSRERAARPAGAAATPATLDHATIEKIRALQGDGSAALLQRVVTQFTVTAPSLAATIRAKTGEGDADAVWRAAHSLKSSAGAIGASLLATCCSDIETTARDRGAASVEPLLDRLDAELVAVTLSLKELA
jgi:two-component system sensor histidine kinase/response regulator